VRDLVVLSFEQIAAISLTSSSPHPLSPLTGKGETKDYYQGKKSIRLTSSID
jgi:hypothetical protein